MAAQIYWLLNAPGFKVDHMKWVEMGGTFMIDEKTFFSPSCSTVEGDTVIELLLYVKHRLNRIWAIRSGEIVNLEEIGIDAQLWPLAVSVTGTGSVQKMLIGFHFNKTEGGKHDIPETRV